MKYNLVWHYRLPFILSSQTLLSYYPLAEIVEPAEVEPQYFVSTAGSLNLHSNNWDLSRQRGAPVTADRVSVHLMCPASSAVTETCMTGQTRVLTVTLAPEDWELMDGDRKREGWWRHKEKMPWVCWEWGLLLAAKGAAAWVLEFVCVHVWDLAAS